MTEEEIKEYKSAFISDYHSGEEKHTREVIDVFYLEYQYYQVRKTYQWVQEQFALSGDKMAIRREILLQRLRGSNSSPIEPEDLEYMIANMKKSDRDIIINGKWRFLLYPHGQGTTGGFLREFDPTIPYIVGVDPSAGGGGDNFAITIINPYNLRIAAEFKNPYISGPQSVKLLVSLVEDYIPNCLITIEKNSMGITIIQTIVEETSIGDRLYYSEQEAQKQLDGLTAVSAEDYEMKRMSVELKKYGTYNTPKVRAAMIELLFKYIAECKQILNTEYLLDDICKLVRKNGKVQALDGEHDDSLFSYLHAMFVYTYGDKLERWGIDNSVNPVIDMVEEDYQDKLNERDPMKGFYEAQKPMSYQEFLIQDRIRMEGQIKTMVKTLDFVHDDVYSPMKEKGLLEGTTSIDPYFFDQVNNL